MLAKVCAAVPLYKPPRCGCRIARQGISPPQPQFRPLPCRSCPPAWGVGSRFWQLSPDSGGGIRGGGGISSGTRCVNVRRGEGRGGSRQGVATTRTSSTYNICPVPSCSQSNGQSDPTATATNELDKEAKIPCKMISYSATNNARQKHPRISAEQA